jgi:signal transduction histidine kinase
MAEFRQHNYEAAAGLYQEAVGVARDDSQRVSATHGLGRMLDRLGRRPAAAALCRDLLKTSSTTRDDDGISLWSSSAAPCVDWGAGSIVLERIALDLDSPAAWPPIQIYRFRTILEGLKGPDGKIPEDATSAALQKVETLLTDAERASQLQKTFSKLQVTATDWQAFGESDFWLVGRGPDSATERPLVLAVRWETLRHDFEKDWQASGGAPTFQVTTSGNGERVSDYLHDFRITFPEGFAPEEALQPQRSFWELSFVVVAALTLLGGILLWRDVRRSAHIAELRTQFVSSVSHELRTPLTSIRMLAELLQMKKSPDPEQTTFLNTIVSESERLTRLLNNVLDFSRIERGQKTYRLQPTVLTEVIDAVVNTLQYPLSQQGFTLETQVEEGIPAIDADADALQQAILNLLTNAMKYSGESRVIKLHVSVEDGAARIRISDHGIGISEDEQTRIFNKFHRARIPENLEISGTGLGLALVAHVAAAHGGSIKVTSRLGEGSTFCLSLPLNARRAA